MIRIEPVGTMCGQAFYSISALGKSVRFLPFSSSSKSPLACDSRQVVGSAAPRFPRCGGHSLVTFRASGLSDIAFFGVGCCMARPKETTIERIYREVTGRKMPPSVKRILLRKRNAKPKAA